MTKQLLQAAKQRVESAKNPTVLTPLGVFFIPDSPSIKTVRLPGDVGEFFMPDSWEEFLEGHADLEGHEAEPLYKKLCKAGPKYKFVYYFPGYENNEGPIVVLTDVKLKSVTDIDDARAFEYGVPVISVPGKGRLVFNLNH